MWIAAIDATAPREMDVPARLVDLRDAILGQLIWQMSAAARSISRC